MATIATKIPTDVWEHIAKNAGVLLSDFTVETKEGSTAWTVDTSKIIGATTGGIKFEDVPEFIDYGEDIDNCPKNMMELKRIDTREVKMSGTFVAVSPETIKKLAGAADLATNKITPRDDLKNSDFEDLWFVVDYGEGGAIAVHMLNALSTAGLVIQSDDKEKGEFEFEFTGHYSMSAQDTVPYEVYIKEGSTT